MKKILLYALGAVLAVIAGFAIYYLKSPAESDVQVGFAASDLYDSGQYPVGSITNYVKDPDEIFDEWGTRYGGEDYRELLTTIEATGEPRTIVTDVWYPAASTDGFPRATYGDFFGNDDRLFSSMFGFLAEQMSEQEADELAAGLKSLERGSFIGAPAAEGRFPLVVLVHGLGGKRIQWNDTAELLASRGYVVVAMTMPSDGTLPPVFSDPNSKFAAANDADAVAAAYEVMGSDTKVFPRFLEYLYGLDVSELSPDNFPDLGNETAPDGGAHRMTEMMARLFQQRVDDVGRIVADLQVLASDRASCEAHYAGLELSGKACGLLEDRIDFDNVGMSGHSLGSISTQVALRQLPVIKAGVGFNNGIPLRWEPLYHGVAPEGTKSEIDKPVLFIHGTEDAFVYFVFQLLFGDWYENSGGDRTEVFPLEDELAPRTMEHSQPVVFASYNRAIGPKMVVSVIDGNHDGMNNPGMSAFMAENGLEMPNIARRLPDHDGLLGAYPGPNFRVLGPATDSAGEQFDLTTYIGNYYLAAWFDWQLKGDASALERVTEVPFAEHVKVRRAGL